VTVLDSNHLEAVTPPGLPGPVDVRLENPGGLWAAAPGAFTYTPVPCAVTSVVAGLAVTREGGRVRLVWEDLQDPCLGLFRVFTAADPDPASPPAFPGDFADGTGQDEDGAPGTDLSFLWTSGVERLHLFQVAAEGSDGTLGPR
jgi:hypothetical protein